MPFPEIVKGTTTQIMLTLGPVPYAGVWTITNDSAGDYARQDQTKGCMISPTTNPNIFDIYVPLYTPSFYQSYIVYTSTPGVSGIYNQYAFVDPPPEPPTTGWTRRLINIPFRRRRPSPTVQPK